MVGVDLLYCNYVGSVLGLGSLMGRCLIKALDMTTGVSASLSC